ncbi:hypothetical protein LSAT2_027590, partial [Lamellibrachia satsuma]
SAECEESCDGKPDGLYAANCTSDPRSYVNCVSGLSFVVKCRPGHYFDVDARECVRANLTGNVTVPTTSTMFPFHTGTKTTPSDECEESCAGMPDGEYAASCTHDCRHYVKCVFGFSFEFKCRPEHYFDVDARKCVKGCPTGPLGILDCDDRPDGLWQHCCYCDTYATCANNGIFFHSRCGIGGLVWDDAWHKCLWTSGTCRGRHLYYRSEATLPKRQKDGKDETRYIQQ